MSWILSRIGANMKVAALVVATIEWMIVTKPDARKATELATT